MWPGLSPAGIKRSQGTRAANPRRLSAQQGVFPAMLRSWFFVSPPASGVKAAFKISSKKQPNKLTVQYIL